MLQSINHRTPIRTPTPLCAVQSTISNRQTYTHSISPIFTCLLFQECNQQMAHMDLPVSCKIKESHLLSKL